MNIYKIFLIFVICINYFFIFREVPKYKNACYILICFLLWVIINLQFYFITPDTVGYKNIYELLIKNQEFKLNIYEKDNLWLNLNRLVNVFINSIYSIYLITSISFLVKCYIIYKLSNNPLHALLGYAIFFFQLHELTQHRISVASMFYLTSIYFLCKSSIIKSIINNVLSILCHLSIMLNPIIYLYNLLSIKKIKIIITFIFILVIFTIFPNQSHFINIIDLLDKLSIHIPRMFEQYITMNYNVIDKYSDYFPIIYIPLTLYIILFKPQNAISSNVIKISYFSILIGYTLLWFFSDFYVVGGRYFEFYLVPIVLLFGYISNNFLQILFFHFLILLFFIRNFILANFIV